MNGILLLSQKEAIKFLDECEEEGIDLLGVDRFRIKKEKIQPFSEYTRDYTSASALKKNNYKMQDK